MSSFLATIENILARPRLAAPQRWLGRDSRRWWHLIIIGGILFLSAVLPLRFGTDRLQLFILMLAGIGAVIGFLRWPALGVAALIISSILVPSPPMPGGLNIAVLLVALMIGLWILELLFGEHVVQLFPSRTILPLVALIVVSILAFGLGQLPWFDFASPAPIETQLGGLATFVLAAGLFLTVGYQVKTLRWLEGLTWLFLAIGTIFIAGWLVSQLGRFTAGLFQLGAVSNSMFWVWIVALAFGQALYNRTLRPGWRLALGGLVVATIYVGLVLNSGWKSGYLPPLASVAVIIALRSWRASLLVVVAGVAVAPFLLSDAVSSDEYSYYTRLDALFIMLEIIKVSPVLGLGPANYYWYTPLFPIRGYAVSFNSHNNYVDIVAQIGLLGLACFAWFAWEVGRLGWRLRGVVPEGFGQAYVYGALGGLAGTLVAMALADWVFPFIYNIGLNGFRGSILAWVFLGGLLSVEQIVRRQSRSQVN
jgi:hypothetical protein